MHEEPYGGTWLLHFQCIYSQWIYGRSWLCWRVGHLWAGWSPFRSSQLGNSRNHCKSGMMPAYAKLTSVIQFPEHIYFNATLTVNTTGIQSNVSCSNPRSSEPPVLTSAGGTNLTFSSKSIDGCPGNVTFDPNVRGDLFFTFSGWVSNQVTTYGVTPVLCPGNGSLAVQFQPVMFWYAL